MCIFSSLLTHHVYQLQWLFLEVKIINEWTICISKPIAEMTITSLRFFVNRHRVLIINTSGMVSRLLLSMFVNANRPSERGRQKCNFSSLITQVSRIFNDPPRYFACICRRPLWSWMLALLPTDEPRMRTTAIWLYKVLLIIDGQQNAAHLSKEHSPDGSPVASHTLNLSREQHHHVYPQNLKYLQLKSYFFPHFFEWTSIR